MLTKDKVMKKVLSSQPNKCHLLMTDGRKCHLFRKHLTNIPRFIINYYTQKILREPYSILEIHTDSASTGTIEDQFSKLEPPINTCFAIALTYLLDIPPEADTLKDIQKAHESSTVDFYTGTLEQEHKFRKILTGNLTQAHLLNHLKPPTSDTSRGYIVGGTLIDDPQTNHCFAIKSIHPKIPDYGPQPSYKIEATTHHSDHAPPRSKRAKPDHHQHNNLT
jgi:hypothetical protein